jgi:hypothetical protein
MQDFKVLFQHYFIGGVNKKNIYIEDARTVAGMTSIKT